MTIVQIKAAMNEKTAAIKALAAKEETEGSLCAEDIEQFKQLQADHANLAEKLNRAETAQRLAVQESNPVTSTGIPGNTPAIHVKSAPEDYKGAKIARIALALMASDNKLDEAMKFAATDIRDKDVSMALTTAADSGGSLVPEAYSRDFIELLRPQLVVAKMGARVTSLPRGKLTLSRQSGGATSQFRGEGQPVNASSPKTEPVKMSAKSQMTIVPMSKELKGRADFDAEQMVLDDMLAAHADCQDKAFLRGDGTGEMPKGLLTLATDAGRVTPFVGDVELAVIDAFLDGLILAHKNSNSKMRKCGWILSPRTWMKLYGLRDANGNKVYPEMEKGQLKRYPVADTTNVPDNLGVGGDFSEIYFTAFDDVVIGYDPAFSISTSEHASYFDADGNVQHAYANDEIVVKLVGASDIICRHPEGIAMGSNVPF